MRGSLRSREEEVVGWTWLGCLWIECCEVCLYIIKMSLDLDGMNEKMDFVDRSKFGQVKFTCMLSIGMMLESERIL